jgi:RNA polymerase sigma-70 factor, ECF subfamily
MLMGLVRRMPADSTAERDQPALIAAARGGSADALGALYDRHARTLLATAYRLLQSRADAEDVVHDVFVGLPELLRKYEERGAFGAWLKTVTARVALARLREMARHAGAGFEDPAQVALASRDLEGAISLEAALRKLSPALRAVLVLKEIEGFSHAEVARMLDISVGASEVRLHRALQSLRALLRTGDQQ